MVMIVMNLIPMYGVLFWGWSVTTLLAVYWAETLVIGLLNIPKILACRAGAGLNVETAFVFTLHFFSFSFIHAIALFIMFFANAEGVNLIELFSSLFNFGYLFWAAVPFFFSHLFSMIVNFYGQKEYLKFSPDQMAKQPYVRIGLMHATLLLGGAMTTSAGSPAGFIIAMVVLKTAMDIYAHMREHSEDFVLEENLWRLIRPW